ncbi:hypothetical protein [Ensifer sp. LCM 4579]|uniref:hypothetical protein n=1 Tax=Ensifer sp. LCM 4579 TaxID=1848292 RepID=UPI0008D96D7A|nr:hypothetical protein [Ensifer sp. LCM 4579]OHV81794.1 hypothetical protein LCM4579_18530 [Ensifer sp. LCM 4579]
MKLRDQFRERAVVELKDVRDQVARQEEQIVIATAVLLRTSIRSPIDGIVQNLQRSTPLRSRGFGSVEQRDAI